MKQRLQKIIANAGITSRRKAEELINLGRVEVNGKVATIGQSADPEKDKITVEGQKIKLEQFVYYIINKPRNVVTSNSDPLGRETVRDLLRVHERVFPVGRLDRNSTGLVLMTNDGQLADRIMHPKYETVKTYVAKLSSGITPELIKKLKKGVWIDRRKVVISRAKRITKTTLELSIHEGRKHIVKKLLVKAGTHVDSLHRTELGPLKLGTLKKGYYRKLNKKEILSLRNALKL